MKQASRRVQNLIDNLTKIGISKTSFCPFAKMFRFLEENKIHYSYNDFDETITILSKKGRVLLTVTNYRELIGYDY